MLPGILGTKIGMTHLFNEDGKMVPVTVIQAGPVYVTQLKTEDVDGYTAVQVGYGDAKEQKLTFPKHGHTIYLARACACQEERLDAARNPRHEDWYDPPL